MDISHNFKFTQKDKNKSSKHIPVSIIIITYKSNKYLKKCLSKILESTLLPSEIIIIDNNSPKSPKERIIKFVKSQKDIKLPSLFFYKNQVNYGFAKSTNMGIKLSSNNNILLLNPDLFLDRNALEQLFNTIKTCSIIGGKTFKENGSIYPTITKKITKFKAIIEFTSLKKCFLF
jgi:GT2 family glycosyltransferase